MGLMIHSLCELPAYAGSYERDFYVYILDYGWGDDLSTEMHRQFPRMAEAASRHGAVVLRGTVGHHFADEVFSWHHVNGVDAKGLLPAILVTTKHPQAFRQGCWGPAEQKDRMLLIPLREVCKSPSDIAYLLDRLFSDIQEKQRLSQFDVARRMIAGRDGATLDAIVLKSSSAGPGLKLSDALSFLGDRYSSGHSLSATADSQSNSRSLPSQFDIAIITILPEEYEAVKRRLKNVRRDPGSKDRPNQYAWVIGEIEAAHEGTYQVVLAMTVSAGNATAGLGTTAIIARWSPRYILLVGIAGGLPRDQLKLGDVVVSTQIVSYEYGKVQDGDFNPRPNYVYQVDGPLLRGALSLTETNWRRKLGRRPGRGEKPKVLMGMVGSGEKVIDDRSADFFRSVERQYPKILAVEMEGAGAAAAIQEARDAGRTVGFLMIRGVSDMPPDGQTAGKTSGGVTKGDEIVVSDRDRWKTYAANAAASFAACFVAQACPLPPGGTRTVSERVLEPLSDAQVLQSMEQVFDRPAFTTPFGSESSLPGFKQALTDTIMSLNTGVRRTRDGTELGGIPSRHNVKDSKIRSELSKLVRALTTLRSTFDRLIRIGDIKPCSSHCGNPECPIFELTPTAVREMDQQRQSLLDIFRRLHPKFDARVG
ncbi:MAG: hypothetical protein JNL82_08000 [Myxococcales bacterium]|nr:hypothetical protein [Myxococcales bacterium]